jgi:hypothetical protein
MNKDTRPSIKLCGVTATLEGNLISNMSHKGGGDMCYSCRECYKFISLRRNWVNPISFRLLSFLYLFCFDIVNFFTPVLLGNSVSCFGFERHSEGRLLLEWASTISPLLLFMLDVDRMPSTIVFIIALWVTIWKIIQTLVYTAESLEIVVYPIPTVVFSDTPSSFIDISCHRK